ncbi:hypothetical protein AWC02_06655 [Mycolicibacter engbaekii]|uniref:PE-PGRS family protein n=1 Tax=Mycolicibacter engbaekii TaxID=188915 RepID=A0A1X1TXH3_9MYCO|nr:hypothetical protein AWC02_06655 [Mycolicibacter engbaekii]
MKAGALMAGTAFAGAALLGGTAVAPAISAGISASAQHEVMLTATYPTFAESLQSLLDAIELGNMGQVLGIFGDDIDTATTLAVLLAALNPDDMSLDTATLGMLSADITALLDDVDFGGNPLGSIPITSLLGGFIGGDGAATELGTLLGYVGLGEFAGLLNIPFTDLSPETTVAELLEALLGIDATTSLNDLLDQNGMEDATIGGLLGISPEQLAAGWDSFVSSMVVGGTLADPDGIGVLGDQTLGSLLTALLGTGADPVTDLTTLTDFLGDLGLFEMLGLG